MALETILSEHIQQRLRLLKEGEELDYDQLEEELVGVVTKAMMPKKAPITPSPAPRPDPADKDPNQWRQMPTTQAKPLAEDENGCPTQAPQMPTADPMGQHVGPGKRFQTLKEAFAKIEAEHGGRNQSLLEQRNAINAERRQIRKTMQEARQAIMEEHRSLYEACARKLSLNTEEKDWRDKVNSRLQESNLL
jgi:hypothetical protein